MSCYSFGYLPRPPRLWSRVQNPCAVNINNSDPTVNELVSVPYSRIKIPESNLDTYLAMLNKGNVLQYKANSSSLTKAQRYSKIAKGKWINRNTTWATQSTRGYTNPNTTSLKRNGDVFNINIDPTTGQATGVTDAPPTCPILEKIINYFIPINGGGGGINPVTPPPPPPINPNDPGIPVVPPLPPLPPIVIQDGGILDCAVQENICTGELQRHLPQEICNPTYDSDVPGQIEALCWRDGTPTWYPRQRYIMNNSTDKWPYNSGYPSSANRWGIPLDGIIVPTSLPSAVKPIPPIIKSASSVGTIITIEWFRDAVVSSLPITDYIIFLNGLPIASVPKEITSASVIGVNCYNNKIFMICRNGDIYSESSNVVTIPINVGCASTN